jgi:DUF4097 and DUF4098 domain-containing protein YvlB
MGSSRRKLAVGVLALVAVLPAVAGAQRRGPGRDYRSRLDTTVAFAPNGSLVVSAGSGDVVITGTTGNELRVRASSDDNDIRFDATRNVVELATARRGSDSRFEISVPVGARVTARTQSGDISVRGTRGEVNVTAQSGDIEVEDVNGRLDVRSFSGEVTASNIVGDVEISTQSGDLRLTNVRGDIEVSNTSGDIGLRSITARNVRARTTSGDVVYDGTIDPAGRYEFVSHSGDVRLSVPRDASAQLTVSTWNGEIESAFPITLKPGEHGIGSSTAKRFTFSIGSGAARITAETFSGDVTVSSNGRGAAGRP